MKNQATSARRITLADHFNTRFSFTELFHSYNYFPSRVSLFEIAHRFRGLAQLVSPVDDGCHLPRLHEVAQHGQIPFVQFRNIPDELLTDEPRQQIRFESPNHTSQRFRVKSCSSDSGKDADATRT